MESKTEEERVAEEYASTLSELNSISKVEINALTMLAEDNKEFAIQIAACIENHLKAVPSKKKLPILYLIDSICKNYPKSIYVQLFTQNIVSNFCNIFECSGEKVRKSLHKLRMTWDTTKTFPQKKLNAIDRRVHEMDPNWPILNAPIQRQRQQPPPKQHQQPNQPPPPPLQQSNQHHITPLPQAFVVQPHELPQQPIQQPIPVYPRHVQSSQQATQLQPPLAQPHQIGLQPQPPAPQQQPPPTLYQANQHLIAPDPQAFVVQQHEAPMQQMQQISAYLQHVQNLQQAPQLQQPQTQQLQQNQHQKSLPADLDSTLNSLYGGKQCSNCSLRFDDNNKYSVHLDWHFRRNLKSDSGFARRKWYYPLDLWVQFREINDDDIQTENDVSDNNVNDLLISNDENELPTASASKEDEKNICSVCHEAFEKFWAEEEEEWRLKNARQHDDQMVYHPLCLKDMLQSSVVQ